MQAERDTSKARLHMPLMGPRGGWAQILLCRWTPATGKFVFSPFDWADPLDAALGRELVRFQAGVDQYDA